MQFKKYIIMSVALHFAFPLGFFLLTKMNFIKKKPVLVPITATMVFKNAKKADSTNLPRKIEAAPLAKPLEALKKKVEPTSVAKKDSIKAKPNFLQELGQLSKEYEQEIIVQNEKKQAEDAVLQGSGNYLDEVHTMIKDLFILPSHLNNPQRKNISAMLKIHIDATGKLSSVSLEKSSGDKDFDEAIMYATKKVNNFGNPPILMQKSLQHNGILIQFCPFQCREGG